MGRVVDNLFKYVFFLIFGLLALRVAVSLIEQIARAVLAPFTTSLLGSLGLLLGLVLLVAGLLVRGVRAVSSPRGRASRERGTQERSAVRRPAVDAPLAGGTPAPEDNDPALPHEDR